MAPEHEAPRRTGALVSPLLWVRILHVGLWLLMVAGVVAGAVAMVEVAALRDEVVAAAPVEPPVNTGPAEGAAVLGLIDHLSAADGAGRDSRWLVEDTVALAAEQVAAGRFVVTVAARLTPGQPADDADPTNPDALSEDQRLVFTVEVAESTDGWVAGTPALVAAPVVATDAAPTTRQPGGLDEWPGLEDTVTRFLAALLTGDGELARYTAPDTDLAPVAPSPFISVSLLDADAAARPDGSLDVTAQVEATASDDAAVVLGYRLAVAQRAGRWEITALAPTSPLVSGFLE
jgi:hypothetical protein